jgi:hypothetical protein
VSWLTSEESIQRYNEAMRRASSDAEAFEFFRRAPGIREIVEGVPTCVGRGYHEKLRSKLGDEALALVWERITENDAHGNPERLQLEPQGYAASTTMRYAWNVVDMDAHGVVLEGSDIVEVGGGYGGLCRMIHAFHKPKSYTIVDLPEALALADRYLKCYGIDARMVSCDTYGEEPIDTFISNYALTELTKDVQDGYVNKLMTRAVCGYVTFNSQPRNASHQYSLDELEFMVPGGTVIEAENIKRSECQVLIWRP